MTLIAGSIGAFLLFVFSQIGYLYLEEWEDRKHGIPPTTFWSKLRWSIASFFIEAFGHILSL